MLYKGRRFPIPANQRHEDKRDKVKHKGESMDYEEFDTQYQPEQPFDVDSFLDQTGE